MGWTCWRKPRRPSSAAASGPTSCPASRRRCPAPRWSASSTATRDAENCSSSRATPPREQDWLAELRFCLIDRYFEQDHDLVVDTRAMLDGPDRPVRKVFFRAGPLTVNHFSYFGNEDSAAAVAAALTDAVDTATLFHDYAGNGPCPPRPRAASSPACARRPAAPGRARHRGARTRPVRLRTPGRRPRSVGERAGPPAAVSARRCASTIRRSSRAIPGRQLPRAGQCAAHAAAAAMSYACMATTGASPSSTRSRARRHPVHRAGAMPRQTSRRCTIVHSMGGVLIRAAFAQDRRLWKRWKEQLRPGRASSCSARPTRARTR